jgi:hypothetical protein
MSKFLGSYIASDGEYHLYTAAANREVCIDGVETSPIARRGIRIHGSYRFFSETFFESWMKFRVDVDCAGTEAEVGDENGILLRVVPTKRGESPPMLGPDSAVAARIKKKMRAQYG